MIDKYINCIDYNIIVVLERDSSLPDTTLTSLAAGCKQYVARRSSLGLYTTVLSYKDVYILCIIK